MFSEMLKERKLVSEFTMGFELEAIWKGEEDISTINEFFKSYFGDGGDLHDDSSINSDDYDDTTFEYASPVFPVNITTFNKIVNFFDETLDSEYYVNDSCGFHHHISYPGITADDVIWLMSKLSLDDKMKRNLKFFGDYNFESYWSDTSYLDTLKYAVEMNDFKKIFDMCNTDKYSLINVHRNKTLEWRGPRGFLNDGDKNVIKSFYIRVWEFVKWIIDTLDEKEINGLDRDNFIEQVKMHSYDSKLSSFKFNAQERNKLLSTEKLNKIYSDVISNPKVLMKFLKSPKPLEQIIQKMYNNDRLGKRIYELNQTEPKKQISMLNNICYKYIPYRIMVQFGDTITEDTKYNTSELTLKRLVYTRRLDGGTVSNSDIVNVLYKLYPYINPSLYKSFVFMDFITSSSSYEELSRIDGGMKMLKTISENSDIKENIEFNKIIYAYMENSQNKVAICKDILKTYGDVKGVANVVNRYMHINALEYPEQFIPILDFTEKGLWMIISKAKKTLDTHEFYDKFKPLMITSGKISENDFDKIDREVMTINISRKDKILKNQEPEYDMDELVY